MRIIKKKPKSQIPRGIREIRGRQKIPSILKAASRFGEKRLILCKKSVKTCQNLELVRRTPVPVRSKKSRQMLLTKTATFNRFPAYCPIWPSTNQFCLTFCYTSHSSPAVAHVKAAIYHIQREMQTTNCSVCTFGRRSHIHSSCEPSNYDLIKLCYFSLCK